MKIITGFVAGLAVTAGSLAIARQPASELYEDAGVSGGLVVHLGVGDGQLTTALGADERYVVHGLDRSAENVAAARLCAQAQGCYGKVSIERLRSNTLPYNDNLVNLIVVSDPCGIAQEELLRVLAPGGVALAVPPSPFLSQPLRKPWPDEIDQWTHFLYDASGNAVAKDTRVGPPRHLQWTAGPKRTRDHDALSSFTTMTSSNGRVFYILDEGPTSQIHRRPQWRLCARDAFNGVPLWKREIGSWVTHLYNFRAGPVQMTRRLVSVGDRVYVTLGYDAAITALDAASGETLLTYDRSKNTEELILQDNVLLAVIGDPRIFDAEAPQIEGYWETRVLREPKVAKSIVAYRADTGEVLWKKTAENLAYLVPLSLCAAGDKAMFLDNQSLHCVQLASGRPLWSAPYRSEGLSLRNYAPTVALHKDVVVCLSIDKMAAFDTRDGRLLWSKDQGYYGFGSPGDLFVIDDLVWTFPHTAGVRYDSKARLLGNGGKEFWALDLYTGEVKESITKQAVWPGGHHHRCYRNKATEQYAVCGRRGLEFVDLTGGDDHVINWWARGICQYGIMPCNGMVYVPPDPCQCFKTIKVDGLLALGADSSLDTLEADEATRLIKGPAFGKLAVAGPADEPPPDEWPAYRHDGARSGATASSVPSRVEEKWQARLGGKPSSVVVSQDRLLVGAVDRQRVHCLDAATGQQLWEFTVGGAVDSPPTIHGNFVLFGSRDGRVYALHIEDGQLAWSYRAAPVDRRLMSDGRLESVWPIHGSVLVLDDIVYLAAGRSSFLDGGIKLCGLDVHTGEKRYEATVDSTPADGNNSGALPDVLVSDGTVINMRQLSYDRRLQAGGGGRRGAFSTATGLLLEDGWGHRLTWNLDGASGNLLAFSQETVYGVQSRYVGWKKNKANWPPTHSGHLHQKYSRYLPQWFPVGSRVFAKQRNAAKSARRKSKSATAGHQWANDLPIQVRAMVLAGETLFAAGWPDAVTVLDQSDPDATERDLQEPRLWAFAADDGRMIAEYELEALPVFDGAAAAYGKLYLALQNGTVVCFGAPQ